MREAETQEPIEPVAEAARLLAEGMPPHAAVSALIAGGFLLSMAVLATCLALDVPKNEAERRVRDLDPDRLLVGLPPADADAVAHVLECFGVFDRVWTPDRRGQLICDELRGAMSSIERWPSGVALRLHRLLAAGHVAEALVVLVERAPRERPTGYWISLRRAAELIGDPPSLRYTEAVHRISRHLE